VFRAEVKVVVLFLQEQHIAVVVAHAEQLPKAMQAAALLEQAEMEPLCHLLHRVPDVLQTMTVKVATEESESATALVARHNIMQVAAAALQHLVEAWAVWAASEVVVWAAAVMTPAKMVDLPQVVVEVADHLITPTTMLEAEMAGQAL
jgi:hypothetical protein